VLFGLKRSFLVPLSVEVFFVATLLANGMTVKFFSLYFTQILHFSPSELCWLNVGCRLFISVASQAGKPLSRALGRGVTIFWLHLGSAVFMGLLYGYGLFEPPIWLVCISYYLRFAFLHMRDPLLYSITMDTVPPDQKGRWAALSSVRSMTFGGSALIGGFLSDSYGYTFSFHVTVVSLLASTLLFLPVLRYFPAMEGRDAAREPATVSGEPSTTAGAAPLLSTSALQQTGHPAPAKNQA
jgi:predicted MFS family arabinose efflux permease